MARPGVLLAVCPGATRERLAVEAELVRRGWRCVAVPAEADLLVIVGDRGAEESGWVANLWRAMPAPKSWVPLTDAAQVTETLDRGLAALRRGEPSRPVGVPDGRQGGSGPPGGPETARSGEHHHHDHHRQPSGHAAHEEAEPNSHAGNGRSEKPDQSGHGDHHDAQGGHGSHAGHTEHAEHQVDDGHTGHGGHQTDDGHHGHAGHRTDDGHDGHAGHAGHTAHHTDAGHEMGAGHAGHQMDGGHHGHAGHELGGMVDGLPMADRADDRDGLRLDQLHVPLGPGLAAWPAGLVLRLTLQGDVVQQAGVEPLVPASPHPPFWNEPWLRAATGERVTRGDAARRLGAAHLDSLGRFFAVAGWADMAGRARHVRDRALAGADAAELSALVRPLIRRAERSRTLRWLTAGLGPLPAEHACHLGVTGPALGADGDAYSRMLVWLDAVGRSTAACDDSGLLDGTEAVGPRGRLDGPVPPSRALLDALPGLLAGAEFACARIIVASLDPDLDELAHVPAAGAAHV